MKKTYLFAALCLLLIGMKSSAMLIQARRWIAQRISPQVAAGVRVATTADAKNSEQKRLFSYYDAFNNPQKSFKAEEKSATKELFGALSAYVAYFFGGATPVAAAINKGDKNYTNERMNMNKKNLGPLHKPLDYNEPNDDYKMP